MDQGRINFSTSMITSTNFLRELIHVFYTLITPRRNSMSSNQCGDADKEVEHAGTQLSCNLARLAVSVRGFLAHFIRVAGRVKRVMYAPLNRLFVELKSPEFSLFQC